VVARYAELNVDEGAFPVFANPATSASAAQAWAVGLNWYLNKNIRVNASFSRTTFTGGGGAGNDRAGSVSAPEDVSSSPASNSRFNKLKNLKATHENISENPAGFVARHFRERQGNQAAQRLLRPDARAVSPNTTPRSPNTGRQRPATT
jgi:hypothetical protein